MHLILKGLGAVALAFGAITTLADMAAVSWGWRELIPGILDGLNGLLVGIVLLALGTILKRIRTA